MDFIQENVLTLTLFSPLLAALILFVLPEDEKNLIRRLAFAFSLVPLALTIIYMWLPYDRVDAGYQFVQDVAWFEAINARYIVGVLMAKAARLLRISGEWQLAQS